MFPKIVGFPKSSILIGVFHYKPSILGETPLFFGNIHLIFKSLEGSFLDLAAKLATFGEGAASQRRRVVSGRVPNLVY